MKDAFKKLPFSELNIHKICNFRYICLLLNPDYDISMNRFPKKLMLYRYLFCLYKSLPNGKDTETLFNHQSKPPSSMSLAAETDIGPTVATIDRKCPYN